MSNNPNESKLAVITCWIVMLGVIAYLINFYTPGLFKAPEHFHPSGEAVKKETSMIMFAKGVGVIAKEHEDSAYITSGEWLTMSVTEKTRLIMAYHCVHEGRTVLFFDNNTGKLLASASDGRVSLE